MMLTTSRSSLRFQQKFVALTGSHSREEPVRLPEKITQNFARTTSSAFTNSPGMPAFTDTPGKPTSGTPQAVSRTPAVIKTTTTKASSCMEPHSARPPSSNTIFATTPPGSPPKQLPLPHVVKIFIRNYLVFFHSCSSETSFNNNYVAILRNSFAVIRN